MAEEPPIDVVIVGAGFAGLAAAWHLTFTSTVISHADLKETLGREMLSERRWTYRRDSRAPTKD